ncbi:MAG: TRAP transporter small permease subunit [Boseongicola sp. SB0662_bin_57]|nr:TRAP transporter small permease subunit [Boseongicola sp. SB0662_bin_57]
MKLLHWLLLPFQTFNGFVLQLGRAVAIVAIALMVVAILIQVFFRYVLNNPLPWPDEAARFAMLWMTGLIAPLAYRRGGFVAIDMLVRALPERAAALLSLVLLTIAGIVLGWGVDIGMSEVTGFMSRAKTASLYYVNLDLEWVKVPRQWMMMSFFVGVVLLFLVNVELFLRSLITVLGGGDDLAELGTPEDEIMAE